MSPVSARDIFSSPAPGSAKLRLFSDDAPTAPPTVEPVVTPASNTSEWSHVCWFFLDCLRNQITWPYFYWCTAPFCFEVWFHLVKCSGKKKLLIFRCQTIPFPVTSTKSTICHLLFLFKLSRDKRLSWTVLFMKHQNVCELLNLCQQYLTIY